MSILQPIVSVFYSVDVQRRGHPSISRDHGSDHWNRLCKPTINVAPINSTAPRTMPGSHLIIPAPRTLDLLHCSYQESSLAQESNHGEEIRKPDSAVVPEERE